MEFADYVAYFKNLAVQHKDLLHTDDAPTFFDNDWNRLIADTQNLVPVEKTIMVLLPLTNVIDTDPNAQNTTRYYNANVLMLFYASSQSNSQADLATKRAGAFEICQDIKQRIHRDRKNWEPGINDVIRTFTDADLVVIPVDQQVANGWDGWLMQVRIGTKSSKFNADKWQDLTP